MASPADLHSEGQNQKNKSQFYSARNFSDKIMLVVLSFTVFFITHAEMYIIYLVLLYIAITHIISQLVWKYFHILITSTVKPVNLQMISPTCSLLAPFQDRPEQLST